MKIKRNNPGNIRPSKVRWHGETTSSNQPFCEFASIEWGCRAMLKLLMSYINKHKCNTIEKIIYRWAPPQDNNNTSGYVQRVVQETRIHKDFPLYADLETLIPIACAMTRVEHAGKCPPRDVWDAAAAMI